MYDPETAESRCRCALVYASFGIIEKIRIYMSSDLAVNSAWSSLKWYRDVALLRILSVCKSALFSSGMASHGVLMCGHIRQAQRELRFFFELMVRARRPTT